MEREHDLSNAPTPDFHDAVICHRCLFRWPSRGAAVGPCKPIKGEAASAPPRPQQGYSREEFERDRFGETGERLAAEHAAPPRPEARETAVCVRCRALGTLGITGPCTIHYPTSPRPEAPPQADPRADLIQARNDLMAAIVKLRGGHAAVMDDCDEKMAALDIAIGKAYASPALPEAPPQETPTREWLMRRVAFYARECERQGEIIERYQREMTASPALPEAARLRALEWHRYEGNPPPPVGDCRKLVWLVDDGGMAWIGIRAYHHGEGYWMVGNQREESANVTHWMDLPPSPHEWASVLRGAGSPEDAGR